MTQSYLLPRMLSHRMGVTLIEVIAVFAIISILVSLSLMGLSSVRESIRRTQCTTQVREIAIAVHQFELRTRSLPSFNPSGAEDTNGPWTQLAFELGYAAPKSRMGFDFHQPPYANGSIAPTNLVCASDSDFGVNYRFCSGSAVAFHASLSAIIKGAGNGAIVGYDGTTASRDITDGLSQTALLSERLVGLGVGIDRRSIAMAPFLAQFFPDFDVDHGVLQVYVENHWDRMRKYPVAGRDWTGTGFLVAAYNHILPPNSRYSAVFHTGTNGQLGMIAPTSNHPGGVVIGRVDGSVYFETNSVDSLVWIALSTRSGNENNSENFEN